VYVYGYQRSAFIVFQTRHFSAAPPRAKPDMPPPPTHPQGSKRKSRKNNTPQSSHKRRKTKGKGRARDGDESDEALSSADEDAAEPDADATTVTVRRSQRNKKIVASGYQQDDGTSLDSDIEMEDRPQVIHTALSRPNQAYTEHQNDDESDSMQVKDEMTEPQLSQTPAQHESGGAAAPIDIDVEIEEEKPKPVLTLKYQDFSIYGHCLCIVVEPYPLVRSSPSRAVSRAPSVAPLFTSRTQSAAPSVASLRARTPLFLPDDEERGETPAPFIGQASRPPVPLFDDDSDDGQDSDNGGMMAFSQVMNNYNHLPAGAANDDDDLDGAVFFGDADEIREL
jgi:hypothetical protein